MSLLSQAIVTLKRPYFALRMREASWHKLNMEAHQQWVDHPVALNSVQTRLVTDLQKNGIAFTNLKEFFSNRPDYLSELQSTVAAMRERVVRNRKKSFLLDFFGSHRVLDIEDRFIQYSLQPELVNTINSYLKMWSRFYYFYLGETLPSPEASPTGSQRWHRDPEDKRMCKVFLYLTDVNDIGAGPFTYVRGSQEHGSYRKYFPQKFPQGAYPPAGAVEKVVDPKDILTCLGKAGTIIFCDTSGLHKGGFSTTTSRIMYTAGFSSFASHFVHMYELPEQVDLSKLPLATQFALHRQL